MSPRVLSNFRRLAVCACAGVLMPGAAAAQDATMPELGFLGLRSTWPLEIAMIASDAEESGDWHRGMNQLASIAQFAKKAGDRPAWLEAELAWVKLAARDGEETVLDDAFEELVSRARDWGLARQEA